MTSFSFFVDSDIQINQSSQIDNKEGHLGKMLELIDQAQGAPVKAFLSPGDLTDHGFYYSPLLVFFNKLFKILRIKPIFSHDSDNELQIVLDTYLHPLRRAGVKSYLCAGNHDAYGPFWKPVLSYLRRRHGQLYYSFNINGLHFVCCGIAPNTNQIRKWLKRDLAKLAKNTPVVLMWHYPVSGPYSGKPYPGGEWWASNEDESDAKKVLIYGLIKDYNIIGIFTGHFHDSYRSDWHGIPIFNTGGSSFCHAIYDPQNQSLETNYYDKNGPTDVLYMNYKRSDNSSEG